MKRFDEICDSILFLSMVLAFVFAVVGTPLAVVVVSVLAWIKEWGNWGFLCMVCVGDIFSFALFGKI